MHSQVSTAEASPITPYNSKKYLSKEKINENFIEFLPVQNERDEIEFYDTEM